MLNRLAKIIITMPFIMAIVVVLLGGSIIIFGYFSTSKSEKLVIQASLSHNPSKMELQEGCNPYVQLTSIKGGTQVGIITVLDGSEVKFWFRSHHLSNDLDATKFLFPSGRERIIHSDYFCCEVMFPEEEFKTVEELDLFLTKIEGASH